MDGVHGLGRAARVARGVSAADRAGTGAGLVQPDPWSGAELGAGTDRAGVVADAAALACLLAQSGSRQDRDAGDGARSEEHTSELQSLMRISYAVFCLKKKTTIARTSHSLSTFCYMRTV